MLAAQESRAINVERPVGREKNIDLSNFVDSRWNQGSLRSIRSSRRGCAEGPDGEAS